MSTPKATRAKSAAMRPKAKALVPAGAGTTLASISRLVPPHSVWAIVLLLAAPSVTAISAVYGPMLGDYARTQFQATLKERAEKKAKERPIKEAKKKLKARLKSRSLAPEKKAALLKALEALDDIGLARLLEEAGVTIASVDVESVETGAVT